MFEPPFAGFRSCAFAGRQHRERLGQRRFGLMPKLKKDYGASDTSGNIVFECDEKMQPSVASPLSNAAIAAEQDWRESREAIECACEVATAWRSLRCDTSLGAISRHLQLIASPDRNLNPGAQGRTQFRFKDSDAADARPMRCSGITILPAAWCDGTSRAKRRHRRSSGIRTPRAARPKTAPPA